MIFIKADKLLCVFGSCEHLPAEVVLVHEFTNYPNKPLCANHFGLVKKWIQEEKS